MSDQRRKKSPPQTPLEEGFGKERDKKCVDNNMKDQPSERSSSVMSDAKIGGGSTNTRPQVQVRDSLAGKPNSIQRQRHRRSGSNSKSSSTSLSRSQHDERTEASVQPRSPLQKSRSFSPMRILHRDSAVLSSLQEQRYENDASINLFSLPEVYNESSSGSIPTFSASATSYSLPASKTEASRLDGVTQTPQSDDPDDLVATLSALRLREGRSKISSKITDNQGKNAATQDDFSGKSNSLERLNELPEYYARRRHSRRTSGPRSIVSEVSKLSFTSQSTSLGSMPSLSSIVEHDLASVVSNFSGVASVLTSETNHSGDVSVLTGGSSTTGQGRGHSKTKRKQVVNHSNSNSSSNNASINGVSSSSSSAGKVLAGSREQPIILSLVPPEDDGKITHSNSFSSAISVDTFSTAQSGSAYRNNWTSKPPASIEPASSVSSATNQEKSQIEEEKIEIQRKDKSQNSHQPSILSKLGATSNIASDARHFSDLYHLEGKTLEVLGPNIQNPHKNKPQARWESVGGAHSASNDQSSQVVHGNAELAPLTHNQKNILPSKKDAVPMYRPRRRMSNTDSDEESEFNCPHAPPLSRKLGDDWKKLLSDTSYPIPNESTSLAASDAKNQRQKGSERRTHRSVEDSGYFSPPKLQAPSNQRYTNRSRDTQPVMARRFSDSELDESPVMLTRATRTLRALPGSLPWEDSPSNESGASSTTSQLVVWEYESDNPETSRPGRSPPGSGSRRRGRNFVRSKGRSHSGDHGTSSVKSSNTSKTHVSRDSISPVPPISGSDTASPPPPPPSLPF